MTQRRFQQIDVFASGPLNGNPLAVVHDAQGLSEAQMAAKGWRHGSWHPVKHARQTGHR